jgi:ABC-type branched-subunit amino acid transport system permease subunit
MAVGGQTTVLGAIVGGFFLQYVPALVKGTSIPPILSPMLYGMILIAVTIFLRQGVVGSAKQALLRVGIALGGSYTSAAHREPRRPRENPTGE